MELSPQALLIESIINQSTKINALELRKCHSWRKFSRCLEIDHF